MPSVAAAAPATGLRPALAATTQPTNVDVESTGPGVNCPMAMASRSSASVSHPSSPTSPPSRNATST